MDTLSLITILGIVVLYLVLVIVIGGFAAAKTSSSREDYLVGNRSFGTIVLFMALFATNMSAVVMIGAPGFGYKAGAGAWGYFGIFFAFFMPLFMITVGYRIWIVGKKFLHITPGQIINHRLHSTYLGSLLTIILTVWTVPYLLVGIQGGAIALKVLTQGFIPYWLGGLIICLVVLGYVFPGGMRATAWSNVFQGIIFIIFIPAAFIAIVIHFGGFDAATSTTIHVKSALLNRAHIPPFQPKTWFSQGLLVALGAVMFPHLIVRYMTARSMQSMTKSAVMFPIALILTWFPAVMIGFWGAGQILKLNNPDFILPTVISQNFPVWVLGLALAGILAAIMSTIDGQVLTLGNLFSEDILNRFVKLKKNQSVRWTQFFVVLILAAAYLYSLISDKGIIDTATFAFSGYALTFFPFVLLFYWERFNRWGAYVGLLSGFIGLWAFHFGWLPQSLTFGFYPIIPLLVVQLVLMIVITYLTPPTTPENVIKEYKDLFDIIKI